MVVYNVHGLVHLAADVETFGPLENYAAFVFESFLYRLKTLVRKPNYPLQQVIGRLPEDYDFTEKSNIPSSGLVKRESIRMVHYLPINTTSFSSKKFIYQLSFYLFFKETIVS
jgi:hypothetical protein